MSTRDFKDAEVNTRRAVIGGAALAGASATAMLLPQAAAAADTIDGIATDLTGMVDGDTLMRQGSTIKPIKLEFTEYVWVKPPTASPANANRLNILAAITEAKATGRAVHLRRGNYQLDNELNWTATTGDPSVVIRGFGDESVISSERTDVRILYFSNANGLTLESFAVKGPDPTSQKFRDINQTAVRVVASKNVTVRDIAVSDSRGSGINLVGCKQSRVVDCRVSDTWSDGIGVYGTSTTNSSDIIIAGNFVLRAGDDAISVVRYASQITDNVLSSPTYNAHHLRVQIQGNNVREGGANGIHVVGGRDIQVQGNLIDGTRAVGILVDRDEPVNTSASQSVQVHGNVVRRAGRVICPSAADAALAIPGAILVPNAQTAANVNRHGIFVSAGTIDSSAWLRVEDVTVVNNEVHESYGRGVVIRGRTNGTVVGNTVRDAADTGFDVAGETSTSIEGLVFARNRAYGCGGSGAVFKFIRSGVVEGCVALNNNVGADSTSDNFRFDSVKSLTVRDNHSIDNRPTPLIDKTFDFVGACDDIVLSGNRENAGTKTSSFASTVTNVRQTEPLVHAAGAVPLVTRYAEGQIAVETATPAVLRVKVGTTWRTVNLT